MCYTVGVTQPTTVEARERILRYFELGRFCPFREWMESQRDARVSAAIDARLTRFRSGNFGDWKPIGEGVCEARIHLGSGPRIYYGEDGNDVILLTGGDKQTQDTDKQNALNYWRIYKERKANERK